MILTIDFNPTIDMKYIIDEIIENEEIKAKSLNYFPGGRGVTIARLLGIFNEKTLITGFLGGLTGQFYHNALMENGIIHNVITIKDDTSTRVEIGSQENNKIIIRENGPRITRRDIVDFYNLYSKLLMESDIIIGGSTLPQGVDTDIYFHLINLCNRKEKTFILDAKGEELLKAIDGSPNIVIISKEELEKLVNLNLNFENEIIRASRYVLDKGVNILVINLYEKGILVLEESTGYRLELPSLHGLENKMETLDNSGIVVGFALGISRNYDLEMTLKLSQAFSIAYTMEKDINLLDMGTIKKLMNEIEIYPINH